MYRKQKGFTLIELLVVIAIIGLLSTLAVVALTSARAKARDAKRLSDVKQVQTALELYFADKGQAYPAGADLALGIDDATSHSAKLCSDSTGFIVSTGTCTTAYMGKVPRDPSTTGAAAVCPPTAPGKTCDYKYNAAATNATTYKLDFYLEGASGDLTIGANCATPDGLKAGACT